MNVDSPGRDPRSFWFLSPFSKLFNSRLEMVSLGYEIRDDPVASFDQRLLW